MTGYTERTEETVCERLFYGRKWSAMVISDTAALAVNKVVNEVEKRGTMEMGR